MPWSKKLLPRFNRNGTPERPMVYSNGEDTVPVFALMNPDGDIVAPVTAEMQSATNAAMAEMKTATDALNATLAPLPAAMSATTASLESRVKAGNAYIATVGKLTLALGLLNMKATIQNPANSGKRLYVYALEVAHDGAALLWPSLILNPTTATPAQTDGTSKFNQNPASLNTTVAIVKAAIEMTAMTGGTLLGAVPLPSGRNVYRDHIYVLPPGTMLGMNVTGVIGLNAMVRAFYWEEAI